MNSEKTSQNVASAAAAQSASRTRLEPPPADQGRSATCDLTRILLMHFELPGDSAVRCRLMVKGLDPLPVDAPVIVSVIAGTVREVRMHVGPRHGRFVTTNGLDHPATPVAMIAHLAQHQGQPVWRPIRTWIPRRQATFWLRRFGVPAEHASVQLAHNIETGDLVGSAPAIAWRGHLDQQALFETPATASLDQQLLSPVGLYTADQWVQRRLDWVMPIWHVAHVSVDINPQVVANAIGLPDHQPRLVAAHFTPGVTDLAWLRPSCVNGPACRFLPRGAAQSAPRDHSSSRRTATSG